VVEEDTVRGLFETYDRIAREFHLTRRRAWPSILELRDCKGKLFLDLGAGTGRNSRHLLGEGGEVIAADISAGMLRVLRESAPDRLERVSPVRCSALSLPFRGGVFDGVAFIAAIHHIPKREGRELALREVSRVMKKGGRAVITAWSIDQPRFAGLSREGRAPEAAGEAGNFYIRWRKEALFYHLYAPEELKEEVEGAGAGLSIVKAFGERVSRRVAHGDRGKPENWVVVAVKTG